MRKYSRYFELGEEQQMVHVISFSEYRVNQGLDDSVFQEDEAEEEEGEAEEE